MEFHVELRQSISVIFVGVLLAASGYARSSSPAATSPKNDHQIGRILSVRKVLRNPTYFVTRYPQIRYYDLFFSVRVSDQTYCAEYTTPVLDEIDDLFSANGKEVEVIVKKKGLTAKTPKGRRIKAYLANAKQCLDPAAQVHGALAPPGFIEREESSEPTPNLPTETSRVTQPTPARTAPKASSEARNLETAKLVADPLITDYVNRLVRRIVNHSDTQLTPTVKVIDSEEVNAFVQPGRHLYVSSGLISASDSEAELASVLAHEVAHATARHDARIQRRRRIWRIASFCTGPVGLPVQVAGFLSSMKLHRDAEREADRLGLEYEYEAGYDPQAFVQFLEKVNATDQQRQSVIANAFGTHPPTEERIKRAQKEISVFLPPRSDYVTDTSEFQQVKLRLAMFTDRQPATDRHGPARSDLQFTCDSSPPKNQQPSLPGHHMVLLLDTNPHQKKVLGVELSVAEGIIERLGQPTGEDLRAAHDPVRKEMRTTRFRSTGCQLTRPCRD